MGVVLRDLSMSRFSSDLILKRDDYNSSDLSRLCSKSGINSLPAGFHQLNFPVGTSCDLPFNVA